MATAATRNADWTRDEHVLALDLYMMNPASPPGKDSPEVAEVSRLLNMLGRAGGVSMTDKYRNPNGVYMKLMNFRRLDPIFQAQGKAGLSQGSRGEEEVWDEFAGDRVRLRAAAADIRQRAVSVAADMPVVSIASSGQALAPQAFSSAYLRFKELIAANDKGHAFAGFHDGIAAAWEGYKPRLRQHALTILQPDSWSMEEIGSGTILRRVIEAIEIQDARLNVTNNLVFWQNRFGHGNRDHRALLEAELAPHLRARAERLLFDLYQNDEAAVFDDLSAFTGGKYPLLAYLYFLKDMDRYMPIQPTTVDRAFRRLGINLITLRHCAWDNYRLYNAAIEEVRLALLRVGGVGSVRLIDAHSFCWLLEKLPSDGQADRSKPRHDGGRVVGGRDASIIRMRYAIEETVRKSNGQTVERIVKHKDLLMGSQELEKLLRELMDLQKNRCALTGIPFQFDGPDADKALLPSADRKDSSGHYELGNLQVVCRFVNFWKGATDDDEFRRLLELVRAGAMS